MMRRLFLLCVLWAVAMGAEGQTITSCAHITPQSPAVELTTNLTALCVLDQGCLLQVYPDHPITSRELFWKIGKTLIPESQYTVINDSVSSVTFEPTLSMHNSLTCSFKVYGQTEITLHGIYLTLGYPPEKPQNLSCICNNRKTLTCTWDPPGRDPIMPTTYTLRQYWRGEEEKSNCVATDQNSFCTLTYPAFMLYIDTVFVVEAVNALGRAESNRLEFDIANILKPDPPDHVRALAVLQKSLKVEWKNPLEDVQLEYNLRYRPSGSEEWSEVPADELQTFRNSFTLQNLQSYTEYVIIIRCKPNNTGFWSDWSKEYVGTTSESAPSQAPEFWRKIMKTDPDKRIIQLMWKALKSHANGIILGYNVTVKKGPEIVDSFNVTNNTCNITVSSDSYEVVLTAHNIQGSSPPSTLIIPVVTDKVVPPADMKFKTFSEDGKLWVEWTPLGGALGYVIEWCANSLSMDCNCDWQREPSNTGRTSLVGEIKPLTYYLIRLNALQRNGQERSGTVGTYLEQGAPAFGPIIHTKSTGKTWVTLTWNPVPLSKQNGFITNYTIEYGDNYGPFKVITVDANVTEYTLKSLAAKTAYSVSVAANTEKGGKAGVKLSFTTLPFDNGEVEAIVVSSCLGFLVFILVLCFLFCNKREQIKKHIWPNVPDPSKSNIAQWSPQTPSRHESKRHPFQDGPFTDVSVVEITADEKKKSYSDPDLKSVDQIKKNTSEGLSSGIGGSSCLSSPQLSGSDSDGISSEQNTSSTVQYSTVIMGGYQGQTPMFSRSESTQPLLISEERPDEQPQLSEEDAEALTPSQYFKQDGGRIQAVLQEPPSATPDPAAQILHLAGFSNGHSLDFIAAHNINPDSLSQEDALNDEQKMYLPQTVRQGGYIPQ